MPFYFIFPQLEETNTSCHCLLQSNTQVEGAFLLTLILIGTIECFNLMMEIC